MVYLRASRDAIYLTATGSFYAVVFAVSGSGIASVAVYRCVSGSLTLLASSVVSYRDGQFRAIVAGNWIGVHFQGNYVLGLTDTAITSGQPGVGYHGDTLGGIDTRSALGFAMPLHLLPAIANPLQQPFSRTGPCEVNC